MTAVDKDRVNRVVHEMSINSRFYRNAKRLDGRLERCAPRDAPDVRIAVPGLSHSAWSE